MKSSSPSILLSETFSKVLNYSYTASILPYSKAIRLYPTNPTAETCAQIWGSKCLSTEASFNQVVFVLHRTPELILRHSLPRQTCRSLHCFRPDERLADCCCCSQGSDCHTLLHTLQLNQFQLHKKPILSSIAHLE